MKKLHLMLATISALSTATLGVRAQECTDLARVMTRESEKFSDQSQSNMLKTANLCSQQYESANNEQRAQIEASYSLFSGGARGSNTQIKEMQSSKCESQYGSYWSNKVTSQEVQSVSQAGADVIRACLGSQSFRLTNLVIQDDALTASFRFGGAGETVINGIVISPQDIADCSVLHNGNVRDNPSRVIGNRLRSGDTLTLACRRKEDASPNPSGSAASDASRKRFSGGLLSISTSSETAVIPLIGYSVPPVSEPMAESLNRQINELKGETVQLRGLSQSLAAQMATLATRASKLESALVATNTGPTAEIWSSAPVPDGAGRVGSTAVCPGGTFVKGVDADYDTAARRSNVHVRCGGLPFTPN